MQNIATASKLSFLGNRTAMDAVKSPDVMLSAACVSRITNKCLCDLIVPMCAALAHPLCNILLTAVFMCSFLTATSGLYIVTIKFCTQVQRRFVFVNNRHSEAKSWLLRFFRSF